MVKQLIYKFCVNIHCVSSCFGIPLLATSVNVKKYLLIDALAKPSPLWCLNSFFIWGSTTLLPLSRPCLLEELCRIISFSLCLFAFFLCWNWPSNSELEFWPTVFWLAIFLILSWSCFTKYPKADIGSPHAARIHWKRTTEPMELMQTFIKPPGC